jgi:alkanesulfonate monooxygenase SsuD/methylene tetrahydromethanopterin reductase-like flavin-dependent oxidoreductase (luciferase family)
MDVGIGLPAAIPGTEPGQLLEWARRAEARGFSSLGTLDRLVYPNYEPLIALAAVAAVTERIRLATTILIGPYRGSAAVVAKQAATLHRLSAGRLVLGIAVGGREDDFEAAGADFHRRGRDFDAMLDQFTRVWSGEDFGVAGGIGPELPEGGPPVLIGGSADAAFERAARHAGWVMGGGSPDNFRDGAAKLGAAWKAAGREGEPRTAALAYFALGDGAEAAATGYLGDYYGWLGEDVAGMIAGSAAKDADTVRGYVEAFEAAGCDELVIFPCDADPGQVDLLADALGMS